MATLDSILRERMLNSRDPVERDCLRAELAGYLARMGKFDDARTEVATIDQRSRWASPRIAASASLAEALVLLEDEFSAQAFDRLRRGHAIAELFRLDELLCSLTAWLAHFTYNQGQFEEMARWHLACTAKPESIDLLARSRVLLTLADAYRYVGDFGLSDRMYAGARSVAVRLGDKAFLAACMYNRAAYGIARLRLEATSTPPSPDQLRQAMLEIESAINYASATGNAGAKQLQSLWRARLLMLLKRFAEALPLLIAVREVLPEAKHDRMKLAIAADIAACALEVGDDALAAAELSDLNPLDAALLETDDRVVYLSSLTASPRGVVSASEVAALRDLQAAAISAHEDTISRLRDQLQRVAVPNGWLVQTQ